MIVLNQRSKHERMVNYAKTRAIAGKLKDENFYTFLNSESYAEYKSRVKTIDLTLDEFNFLKFH